ncbi:MAG TPA: uroporphyrinogen-III C-methyltransferase [Streptosporangiaceae bacterium]|nr:uroporphyrinogen-III C-methyltransferase [Streptosporangiaceae bacterium]
MTTPGQLASASQPRSETRAGQSDPVPVYPLMLSLAGRRAVVVGGGNVALRRTRALLEAGAHVVVIAPSVVADLAELPVTILRRPYREGDLAAAWLAHAATGDRDVNATVAAEADRQRIWCVRADDATASAAWTPAVTRHGEVTVAVTANGDPARSQRVRAAIAVALAEGSLPVRPWRGHRNGPTDSDEQRGWGSTVAKAAAEHQPRRSRPSGGSVALVGGGPGDPGLITVLGRRLLAQADVVITDKLAPQPLLAELDPDVEVIDAGKQPHAHNLTQAQINDLIVARARAGNRVVRLKGGDPFVFGRGGEEALACVEAGVPFQVVPGVTSAIAAPAYAGIPVTHRGITQDFAVVSAHLDPSHPGATVDWAALAETRGTLVLMMAVAHLDAVAAELIKRGRPESTPVAIISDATLPHQQVLTSTLDRVAADAMSAGVRPPAVVVIGDVVRLREALVHTDLAAQSDLEAAS